MTIDSNVRDQILRAVDERREELVDFLQRLTRIPSIAGTSNEGRAQSLVIKQLQEIGGLKIDSWEPSIEEVEKYPLHPIRLSKWNYDNRPNVVGVLKGKDAQRGRSLILNGHIDVVSAEPVSGWKHDPWSGEIKDGKVYGRGSLDMKGGLTAMIYALHMVKKVIGANLNGDVILESVVEEEYGGGGTISAVVKGYTADAAIIPESTAAHAVCVGSCGLRFFRIRLEGKPEWPHLAHYGVNAIPLANKIYDALIKLDMSRAERLRGKHPLFETFRSGDMRGPGRPTNMTVGILRAGDWPATVAGWAELEGRVGFPPSERGEEVQRQVEDAVRKTAGEDEWMIQHQPFVQWWGARREPYELDVNAPIVQLLKRNAESVTGQCEVYATPSAGDGAYLMPRIGPYGGIPTVWYGPGGAGAHTFDEYVSLDELTQVTKVLALTILDWCNYDLRS